MNDYFPFLNGLRCFAILWVLMYHIFMLLVYTSWDEQLSWCKRFCSAGHWGVDLFFVISGFLITGLLMPKDNSNNPPQILRFYIRRFFKIIPSYYLLLITFFIIYLFFFLNNPSQKLYIVNNISFYIFFIDNLFNVNFLLFNHLWTIAVEEHFYLIYPVLIYLICLFNKGKFSKKWLIIVLSCVFFAVNYSRYITSNRLTDLFIQNTFFRVDGLALGCLIKLLQEWIINLKFKKILSYVLLFLSLSLWGQLIINGHFITWYYPTLAAIASASLIISCLMGNELLITIFEMSTFQFIGKISYNLYLWHYPMIFVCAYFFRNYPCLQIPMYILLTFLIGWCLTNTFEKYFLQLRDEVCK